MGESITPAQRLRLRMSQLKRRPVTRFLSLPLLLAFLFFMGCASKIKLQESYDNGYAVGFRVAEQRFIKLEESYRKELGKLYSEIQAKNERLKAFNQLDEDGTLRGSRMPLELK